MVDLPSPGPGLEHIKVKFSLSFFENEREVLKDLKASDNGDFLSSNKVIFFLNHLIDQM